MKRFIRSSLCAALVVILVLGCTLSASAFGGIGVTRWGEYEDAECLVKKTILAKQELDESGNTVSFNEYTYDDAGRILTLTVYDNEKKANVKGSCKYAYSNGNKTVTIGEYDSRNKLINKIVYEYADAFDVLKNFDEQAYNKCTTTLYDDGKETRIVEISYSDGFKKETKKEYAPDSSDEMYLRVDSFSEYNKSWFAVGGSFGILHSKTVNYDESGTIISGEERINEFDSHEIITKQDLYNYDEFEEDFILVDSVTFENKYDGERVTERIEKVKGVIQHKYVYSYNGNTEEMIEYYYTDPDYNPERKSVYVFRDNGAWEKSQQYKYDENSGEWLLTDHYEMKYDEKDRLIYSENFYYSSENGEKIGGQVIEYEYDKYGAETLIKQSTWSQETKELKTVSYSKYILTYDDTADVTSPQTGDNSNMTLWVMLLALSSMGLCAYLVLGKKRNKC